MVAVNDAIRHLPWATAGLSADRVWLEKRRADFLRFEGERYAVTAELIPGLPCIRKGRNRGLSEDPTVINIGGTSGFAALNLAYLKGAKRIVLLGYDFAGSHWYGDYPWSSPALFHQWALEFNYALPQLRDVQVLNASPNSRIECFEKISLEEL